jgi:hypothetical protein
MENRPHILDPIMEKLENYSKSSIELVQLKVIEKVAKFAAIVYANVILTIILVLFICFTNMGISIWLGTLFEEMYLGFFCVAGFYGILGLIYFIFGFKFQKKRFKRKIVSLLIK